MTSHTSMDPARRERPDDEVELSDLVWMFWRYRLPILASGVVLGFGALLLTLASEPSYEASAKLMVIQSKLGDREVQSMSVESFQTLLENQAIAQELVEEFGLADPPRFLTPASFLNGHLTIERVPSTNVIDVRLELWEPELVADVANALSARAVELAERLSRDEAVSARDRIKIQVDESQARLEEAEQRLNDYRTEAQIELLRKDVEVLLGQRVELRQLMIEIEAERARLAMAREQLVEKQRVDVLRRSIDSEPAAMEAAREGRGDGLLSLQLENEVINPVYESLEQQIAESRTRLSGFETRRAEMLEVLQLDEPQTSHLTELYAREAKLARLTAEYDLARSSYTEAATQYERARLQVAGGSAQLQILDRALPPERPMPSHLIRNVGVATVLGLAFGVFGVILLASIRPERA